MKITLSTQTFDTFGFLELNASITTDRGETRRRMNRIATLDGGSVLNDFGFSEADRTIKVNWKSDAFLDARADYLAQNYSIVNLSLPNGFYTAAIEYFKAGIVEDSTINLLIMGKQA